MMSENLEVRKDGTTYCVYIGEACFPDEDTMKSMKAGGYKLYMDGKIYKPDKRARNKGESEC